MLVDSHCHLDFPEFAGDLDGLVSRAEAAGVDTERRLWKGMVHGAVSLAGYSARL